MSVDNAFKWQTLRWQYYYISIPNGYMGEKNVPFYIRKHLNILPKSKPVQVYVSRYIKDSVSCICMYLDTFFGEYIKSICI